MQSAAHGVPCLLEHPQTVAVNQKSDRWVSTANLLRLCGKRQSEIRLSRSLQHRDRFSLNIHLSAFSILNVSMLCLRWVCLYFSSGSTRTYFLVDLWKNHFPIRKGDRAHQSSLYQMFWGMLCVHFRTPLKLRWWPLKIHENIMSCYVAMLPSPQYHRERESSTLSKLNMKRIDTICLFGAAVLN